MSKQPQSTLPQPDIEVNQIQEWARQAYQFHLHGQQDQALELVRRTQAKLKSTTLPDSVEIATSLNWLGMILNTNGYKRDAIAEYQRALAILNRLGLDHDDSVSALYNNLGQAEEAMGNLKQAKQYLESSVSIREYSMPDTVNLGFSLDNLARILTQLGELDNAEVMHNRALDIFELEGGAFDKHVGTALGNLSNVYWYRGNFKKAESYRLRALEIHERGHGLIDSETLVDISSLVHIYLDEGNEVNLNKYLNYLLSLGGDQPTASHRVLAEIFNQLATICFHKFRLDLTERLNIRALELLEVLEGPGAPETLQALCMLGNVQRATGQNKQAELSYKRALTGYQALKMSVEVIAVTLELGKIYSEGGGHQLAEQVFQNTVVELQKMGPENKALLASALGNLAISYFKSGDYDKSEQTFAQALAQLPEDESYDDRPWLIYNLAMLNYHLVHYEKARDLYQSARQLWIEEMGDSHPFVATASSNLALTYWSLNEVDNALAAFSEAEVLEEHEMERILAIGSEEKRIAYARTLQGDLDKIISFCFSEGVDSSNVASFTAQMLLRRKSRVLDSLTQTINRIREQLNPKQQANFNRLQNLRTEIADIISPHLISKKPLAADLRLKQLQEEEKKLEADLSYQSALYASGLKKISIEAIQKQLPSDGVLLEYVYYKVFEPQRDGTHEPWRENRYAVMLLRASGDPAWFDLGQESVIHGPLEQWRRVLRNPNSDDQQRFIASRQLYELLIQPVHDLLEDVSHLLIAPDNQLALIPFGPLLNIENTSLSEDYVVSYVTTGRDVLQVMPPEKEINGIVVIAAPNFEDAGFTEVLAAAEQFTDRGKFGPLPGTQAESETIFDLFDDVTVYTGNDATITNMRRIHHPSVLHVATHGIFSPLEDKLEQHSVDMLSLGDETLLVQNRSVTKLSHPMYHSGLALAGANQQENGIITAKEIADLDLRNTELVVLSACETGLGTIRSGEEFSGLRRAISIAGARAQVTSLWKIPDDATQKLMEYFYQKLLEGVGRAEALQQSQAWIAQNPDHPEWRHPFYWGAFVLSGAWSPIDLCLRAKSH